MSPYKDQILQARLKFLGSGQSDLTRRNDHGPAWNLSPVSDRGPTPGYLRCEVCVTCLGFVRSPAALSDYWCLVLFLYWASIRGPEISLLPCSQPAGVFVLVHLDFGFIRCIKRRLKMFAFVWHSSVLLMMMWGALWLNVCLCHCDVD